MKKMTNHVMFSEGNTHMKTSPLFLAQQADSYSCVLLFRFIQLCFNSKQIHTVVF
ncbi:hypothetical protein HanIR_Chr05g0253781 [Helianthus annuus]|nr:hypothetical protein HanIR_Chr05g0253781 [Helianthus annuus]